MKIIKDKTGTFSRGLWFEDGEIEALAEKHRKNFISPIEQTESPVMDVDKFVEIYLRDALKKEVVLDPYADLQRIEGPNVLGATYFFDDRLEVKIEKSLTEEAERTDQWGRYNATLMHEGGHCILHPVVFQRDLNQQVLFHPTDHNKIKCLRRTIEAPYTVSYNNEWWEWQANQFMANLLMPKELFLAHFEMERNAYGIRDNGELVKDEYLFNAVVGYLANTFHVSKQAVKIRLYELKQIPNLQQEEFFQNSGFVSIGDVLMGRA
ncbi:MAG: ImmA/IrrE family metallo-endopeptidase [candidate division Zixibacteria bacterium]|nr:ImmA/IrrE family metallo-endopeptidase [candidate division Zixibacteria bacterium]